MFAIYYLGDIIEDEMGGACTDMGKVKWVEHVQIWEG
jgi:hypothetical protein